MQYWFGENNSGKITFAQGDTQSLAERLADIEYDMADFKAVNVADVIAAGSENSGYANEEEYYEALRLVCVSAAESGIKKYYTQGDVELVQMVRMLDEMDNVINLLIERAAEWYLIQNPKFSRKYKSMSAKKMVFIIRREKNALGRIGYEIDRLSTERTRLMKEISDRADTIAPNCSALVGGLVAARLISRAGSLEQTAKLPASAIQVLGAESALFTHLKGNTPSPKHGIIFQHRRIHNAPSSVRGKVSRVLGGKLAIAAKIDYFSGELNPEFVEEAQKRIDYVFSLGGTAVSSADLHEAAEEVEGEERSERFERSERSESSESPERAASDEITAENENFADKKHPEKKGEAAAENKRRVIRLEGGDTGRKSRSGRENGRSGNEKSRSGTEKGRSGRVKSDVRSGKGGMKHD